MTAVCKAYPVYLLALVLCSFSHWAAPWSGGFVAARTVLAIDRLAARRRVALSLAGAALSLAAAQSIVPWLALMSFARRARARFRSFRS